MGKFRSGFILEDILHALEDYKGIVKQYKEIYTGEFALDLNLLTGNYGVGSPDYQDNPKGTSDPRFFHKGSSWAFALVVINDRLYLAGDVIHDYKPPENVWQTYEREDYDGSYSYFRKFKPPGELDYSIIRPYDVVLAYHTFFGDANGAIGDGIYGWITDTDSTNGWIQILPSMRMSGDNPSASQHTDSRRACEGVQIVRPWFWLPPEICILDADKEDQSNPGDRLYLFFDPYEECIWYFRNNHAYPVNYLDSFDIFRFPVPHSFITPADWGPEKIHHRVPVWQFTGSSGYYQWWSYDPWLDVIWLKSDKDFPNSKFRWFGVKKDDYLSNPFYYDDKAKLPDDLVLDLKDAMQLTDTSASSTNIIFTENYVIAFLGKRNETTPHRFGIFDRNYQLVHLELLDPDFATPQVFAKEEDGKLKIWSFRYPYIDYVYWINVTTYEFDGQNFDYDTNNDYYLTWASGDNHYFHDASFLSSRHSSGFTMGVGSSSLHVKIKQDVKSKKMIPHTDHLIFYLGTNIYVISSIGIIRNLSDDSFVGTVEGSPVAFLPIEEGKARIIVYEEHKNKTYSYTFTTQSKTVYDVVDNAKAIGAVFHKVYGEIYLLKRTSPFIYYPEDGDSFELQMDGEPIGITANKNGIFVGSTTGIYKVANRRAVLQAEAPEPLSFIACCQELIFAFSNYHAYLLQQDSLQLVGKFTSEIEGVITDGNSLYVAIAEQ